jgi:hypothetical protein
MVVCFQGDWSRRRHGGRMGNALPFCSMGGVGGPSDCLRRQRIRRNSGRKRHARQLDFRRHGRRIGK